jgi:hypothetical protein
MYGISRWQRVSIPRSVPHRALVLSCSNRSILPLICAHAQRCTVDLRLGAGVVVSRPPPTPIRRNWFCSSVSMPSRWNRPCMRIRRERSHAEGGTRTVRRRCHELRQLPALNPDPLKSVSDSDSDSVFDDYIYRLSSEPNCFTTAATAKVGPRNGDCRH